MDNQSTHIDDSKLRELLREVLPDCRELARALASELKSIDALEGQDQRLAGDMTLDQAIGFFGEGRTKIYERINAGQLEVCRRGRRTVITRESAVRALEAIIEEGFAHRAADHNRCERSFAGRVAATQAGEASHLNLDLIGERIIAQRQQLGRRFVRPFVEVFVGLTL